MSAGLHVQVTSNERRHRGATVAAGVLFAATLFVSSTAASAQPTRACTPSCRTGYTCSDGACVSLCNPGCASDERCTPTGECVAIVAKSSPPTTTAASVPAPSPVPTPVVGPSTTVGADAPPSLGLGGLPHVHDGFYFNASLGPAFVASGSVTPPSGSGLSFSGGGVELHLAVGAGLGRGLIVGGTIFGTSVPTVSYTQLGHTVQGGGGTFATIGPFVDWYFDPTNGFHGQLAVGYTALKASQGTPQPIGGGKSVVVPSADLSGSGAGLLLGLGYDFWVGPQTSLGIVAHVQYVTGSVKADGSDASISVEALIPSLSATFTYN